MKKNNAVRLVLISLVSMVPVVALAAANPIGGIVTFGTIISTVTSSIVRSLVVLFATAAMAAFFYGIVQYIWGIRDGKPDKLAGGQKFMVWGLIALFVMFSVWGIIYYAQNIFGITGQNTIIIPDIQLGGSSVSPVDPLGGTNTGVFSCPPGTPHAGSAYRDQASYNSICLGVQGSGGAGGAGGSGTGGSAGGTGGVGGGTTLRPNTWSCTSDSECQSGYCDPVDDVCTAPGSASKKPNGFSCTSSTECESGWCDPADSTCSNPTAAGDVNANGVNCSGIADKDTCNGMNCTWNDLENTCGL